MVTGFFFEAVRVVYAVDCSRRLDARASTGGSFLELDDLLGWFGFYLNIMVEGFFFHAKEALESSRGGWRVGIVGIFEGLFVAVGLDRECIIAAGDYPDWMNAKYLGYFIGSGVGSRASSLWFCWGDFCRSLGVFFCLLYRYGGFFVVRFQLGADYVIHGNEGARGLGA